MLRHIRQWTIEEIQQHVYLTTTELKLLTYFMGSRKSKDISVVCGLLGMSKHRLTKTKRSLDHKLNRSEMKKNEG